MKLNSVFASIAKQSFDMLRDCFVAKEAPRNDMVLLCLLMLFLTGCQTAPKKASVESQQDVISAVGKMTEGLTNTDISREDLKRLAVQMQKDPQARSAVESVNNAMQAKQTGIRYCPVDGKRFSNRVERCTFCGAKLKDLE